MHPTSIQQNICAYFCWYSTCITVFEWMVECTCSTWNTGMLWPSLAPPHTEHVITSVLALHGCLYTGWPKKNATLTINNFKKTRDRMKKLCALSRIQFFSQQDDTKNANFDEGILILWRLFWCNVIFKICTSISKVTIYEPKIFHCLASPGKVSALAL